MAGLVGLVRSPGPRRWCGMVRPSLAFAKRRQPRGARGEDPGRARRARRPGPGDCLAAKLPDADQTPPRAAGGRQGRVDTVEGPAPAGAKEAVDAVAGRAAWCGLAAGQPVRAVPGAQEGPHEHAAGLGKVERTLEGTSGSSGRGNRRAWRRAATRYGSCRSRPAIWKRYARNAGSLSVATGSQRRACNFWVTSCPAWRERSGAPVDQGFAIPSSIFQELRWMILPWSRCRCW
jgi:hypothetical protein